MKSNGKTKQVAGPVPVADRVVIKPAAAGDPEVPEKPVRRAFDAAYKLRVLREVEASPGLIGEILRREGLYSSHLTTWRRQRGHGELTGLTPRKRGRKARGRHPLEGRIVELEREKRRLQRRLRKAELVIEIQKKVSEILGIPLNSPELDEDD